MSVEKDAKILTASHLENRRRPPGRPGTTWMKTIQQDLKSNNFSVNEAIDIAQNCPLWRLMSTSGATQYAPLVRHDKTRRRRSMTHGVFHHRTLATVSTSQGRMVRRSISSQDTWSLSCASWTTSRSTCTSVPQPTSVTSLPATTHDRNLSTVAQNTHKTKHNQQLHKQPKRPDKKTTNIHKH